ncbi:ribosome-associated translation inhibitor RaiA [Eubacteriales bacterium OttesenSCG-928-M02]|nr:ribosome-associated translation inhibitor RaiA [Eubacteriales bacterium OttesenSCG-928-M02]
MRIAIMGKGVEVSDYLTDVIEKRVGKLEKYFRPDTQADVMISMFRGRHVVEITVQFPGMVLRAEEASGDMYASIDAACKKLEKQILRHKTKLQRRLHENAFDVEERVYLEEDEVLDEAPRIVRTKRFAVKPMDEEEAAMQMDLLGHSFFVFANADTNEVNIIYRRRDGDYGLIEPEFE